MKPRKIWSTSRADLEMSHFIRDRDKKRCFRNPNRFCDACENTGKQKVEVGDLNGEVFYEEQSCYYCSKFDPKQLKEIQERELKLNAQS